MRWGFVLITGLIVTSLAFVEAAPQQKAEFYQGEGVVQLVNAKEEIIVVEHGKIKGYSDPMTMSYQVNSADLLKGFKQGDRITFKIDAATEEIIEISRVELTTQSDQPRQERRAVTVPARQERPTLTKKTVLGTNPRVVRGVLATEVINREPAETFSPIPAEIGRLYYFTEVIEAGPPMEILHVWSWRDRNVSEIPLQVQGQRFRTWSYKTIPPTWTGEWRVEARTPEGAVLSSRSFQVEATEAISPKDSEEQAIEPSSGR
ncbi:MAG: DUF2914 domain-containing protein [Candidatus Methylomirabilales bacterium]